MCHISTSGLFDVLCWSSVCQCNNDARWAAITGTHVPRVLSPWQRALQWRQLDILYRQTSNRYNDVIRHSCYDISRQLNVLTLSLISVFSPKCLQYSLSTNYLVNFASIKINLCLRGAQTCAPPSGSEVKVKNANFYLTYRTTYLHYRVKLHQKLTSTF